MAKTTEYLFSEDRSQRSLRRLASPIVFSTETTDRRMSLVEKRKQDDALSVGLRQPHRRSSHDPSGIRRGSALGRFCEDAKPYRLADHCFGAGEMYEKIIIAELLARGLPAKARSPVESYESLTFVELLARKLAAVRALADANAALVAVWPTLPGMMRGLCYEDLEPGPYAAGKLQAGLVALARLFGMAPRNFRD